MIEGHAAFQQSQVAEQKAAEDQPAAEPVEYVDTSAYEQYEKPEGDFVETPGADAEAAFTVPPGDEEVKK